MAMPDPLDNIMRMLRSSNSVDPSSIAERKANIKNERTRLGASPPATRQPPQFSRPAPMRPQAAPPNPAPQQAGTQESMAQENQGQPNMRTAIIRSLNEAIIGLKTEIHRATDPKQKELLEREIQQIRDRVVEMGGDPVWANETIEEGMEKLRRLGTVENPVQPMPTNRNESVQEEVASGSAINVPMSQLLGFRPEQKAQPSPAANDADKDYFGNWARRRILQNQGVSN